MGLGQTILTTLTDSYPQNMTFHTMFTRNMSMVTIGIFICFENMFAIRIYTARPFCHSLSGICLVTELVESDAHIYIFFSSCLCDCHLRIPIFFLSSYFVFKINDFLLLLFCLHPFKVITNKVPDPYTVYFNKLPRLTVAIYLHAII